MAALTPNTRDAVRLRVVDELSYTDLADRLGISEGPRACACRGDWRRSRAPWTREASP